MSSQGIAVEEWHRWAVQGGDRNFRCLISPSASTSETLSLTWSVQKTAIPGSVVTSLWPPRMGMSLCKGWCSVPLALPVAAPAIHGRKGGKVWRQTLLFAGKFASILAPSEVSFLSVHAFMMCTCVWVQVCAYHSLHVKLRGQAQVLIFILHLVWGRVLLFTAVCAWLAAWQASGPSPVPTSPLARSSKCFLKAAVVFERN